jgi:hypothetical protein
MTRHGLDLAYLLRVAAASIAGALAWWWILWTPDNGWDWPLAVLAEARR